MAAAGDLENRLRARLRETMDFPAPGVRFFDHSPILADPVLIALTAEALASAFRGQGVDRVIGVEARGLALAAMVALRLGAGYVPARKPGRLPPPVLHAQGAAADQRGVAAAAGGGSATYRKDYAFELAVGVVDRSTRAVIIDDLLAKGGSAQACRMLVEAAGGTVLGCGFLIELVGLGGAEHLAPTPVHALIRIAADG